MASSGNGSRSVGSSRAPAAQLPSALTSDLAPARDRQVVAGTRVGGRVAALLAAEREKEELQKRQEEAAREREREERRAQRRQDRRDQERLKSAARASEKQQHKKKARTKASIFCCFGGGTGDGDEGASESDANNNHDEREDEGKVSGPSKQPPTRSTPPAESDATPVGPVATSAEVVGAPQQSSAAVPKGRSLLDASAARKSQAASSSSGPRVGPTASTSPPPPSAPPAPVATAVSLPGLLADEPAAPMSGIGGSASGFVTSSAAASRTKKKSNIMAGAAAGDGISGSPRQKFEISTSVLDRIGNPTGAAAAAPLQQQQQQGGSGSPALNPFAFRASNGASSDAPSASSSPSQRREPVVLNALPDRAVARLETHPSELVDF